MVRLDSRLRPDACEAPAPLTELCPRVRDPRLALERLRILSRSGLLILSEAKRRQMGGH